MDTIGRITVPGIVNSGQTFPLTTELSSYGFSVERPVVGHRFGSMDAKQEQRFYSGIGPRKFRFSRGNLGWTEARELRTFWESMQGPWEAFTYNVPNPDGTTTAVLVTFEETPVSFNYLRNACQTGFNLVEVVDPTQTPTYVVTAAPCLRFPSTALCTALLSEVQEIVPLLHIRVRETAVPDIWLSDRRVTLTDNASGAVKTAMGWSAASQLYLPRLTGIGEPGSDVLLSQDIKGSSDNVRFALGNADRVMTQAANDTDLKWASIDLCLFHVNSGIIIQVWKGVIKSFTSDGSPTFPLSCSDGFFQIMNQYPERVASRMCWKDYNDGINCPYAAMGSLNSAFPSASAASCDYYLESPNGCQAHNMQAYFGGQQADPQGVIIKDDSTGFIGFGRNVVTATSIISDTIWGLALPDIRCNSGGNPLCAFIATALMVAYRDESGYADSLGILGAGPLGGFTASVVMQRRRSADHRGAHSGRLHMAGLPGQRELQRNEVPAGNGPSLHHRHRSRPAHFRLLLARPGHAAGVGAEQLRGGCGGLRDPHRQIDHHPALDARSAPDAGPYRLRPVGMGVGPERQSLGGEGADQPVLDCRQHAAARVGSLWQSGDRLDSRRRGRADRRPSNSRRSCSRPSSWAMARARPRSRPPR